MEKTYRINDIHYYISKTKTYNDLYDAYDDVMKLRKEVVKKFINEVLKKIVVDISYKVTFKSKVTKKENYIDIIISKEVKKFDILKEVEKDISNVKNEIEDYLNRINTNELYNFFLKDL